jgi:hypothetical protein
VNVADGINPRIRGDRSWNCSRLMGGGSHRWSPS